MIQLPYTFEIEGERVGWFTITFVDDRIEQHAHFTHDGQAIDSRFALRVQGGALMAFRVGDGDWVTMEGFPNDAYPGSAFVLLMSEVGERSFVYQRIHEPSATVEGWYSLERAGAMVTERDRERITRRFWLDDKDRLVRIDWGLAESHLCASLEEAQAGL